MIIILESVIILGRLDQKSALLQVFCLKTRKHRHKKTDLSNDVWASKRQVAFSTLQNAQK
jgi:hypothetical protein